MGPVLVGAPDDQHAPAGQHGRGMVIAPLRHRRRGGPRARARVEAQPPAEHDVAADAAAIAPRQQRGAVGEPGCRLHDAAGDGIAGPLPSSLGRHVQLGDVQRVLQVAAVRAAGEQDRAVVEHRHRVPVALDGERAGRAPRAAFRVVEFRAGGASGIAPSRHQHASVGEPHRGMPVPRLTHRARIAPGLRRRVEDFGRRMRAARAVGGSAGHQHARHTHRRSEAPHAGSGVAEPRAGERARRIVDVPAAGHQHPPIGQARGRVQVTRDVQRRSDFPPRALAHRLAFESVVVVGTACGSIASRERQHRGDSEQHADRPCHGRILRWSRRPL